MAAIPRLQPLAGLAFVCVVALGAANLGVAQTELAKSSPFMSAAAPAVAASGPSEQIEFAAVRIIGKRTEIDLYDTQAKKNHWIPVGDTVNGMTVVSYDPRLDQVMAKIGGVNKLLKLRQPKGAAAGKAAVATQPPVGFAIADTSNVQKPQPIPPEAPVPASAPTATPTQPAVPLTIARQEEEARMLVSDLLEIGMAQRKAYEEKQKKAADPTAAATPETPAPAPKPDGTP